MGDLKVPKRIALPPHLPHPTAHREPNFVIGKLTMFKCPHCPRMLASERGRTQHINASRNCSKKQAEMVLAVRPDADPPETQIRRSKRLRKGQTQPPSGAYAIPEQESSDMEHEPSDEDQDSMPPGPDDSDHRSGPSSSESEMEEDNNRDAPVAAAQDDINTEMRKKFKDYATNHSDNFLPLNRKEKTQIGLLDVLVRKRAPLNAYKEVLEWHLKESHKLEAHESLKHAKQYSNRTTIIKKLLKRYN